MGQANYSAFNKWKKVWVAGLLEKKHRFIIWGLNCLTLLRDGPPHRETVVADFLESFEIWLPLDNFNNAEWSHWHWVEIFLKKCATKIQEARRKGWRGTKWPATDVGERTSKKVISNLPEGPNTTFLVVICRVSNGNKIILSPNQLQAVYTDARHSEELIDFINKNGRPKEPYIPTSRFKCTLGPDKLDEEYMGLYTNGQMIMDPIYGQISYNCCLSNAFKLKLGYDPKIFLATIKQATAMEIAEHIIRPEKVISTSRVKARCALLLIVIHRFWKFRKRVEVSEGEEDGGQENDTCINVSSDWKNRIDCSASIYIRSNGWLSVKYLTSRRVSGALD